jgi:uncharacterized integral membrane protein
MKRSLIILLVLVLLLVILVIQNSSPIALKLFFWTMNIPVALVILLSIFLGILISILYTYFSRRKKNANLPESDAGVSSDDS